MFIGDAPDPVKRIGTWDGCQTDKHTGRRS